MSCDVFFVPTLYIHTLSLGYSVCVCVCLAWVGLFDQLFGGKA